MTMVRERHENRSGQPLEVEGEIRELVRRGIAQVPPESSEAGVSNLTSLIQRVSGTSVLEIEKLIAEMQELRECLMNEARRVHHVITQYAHMSQAATESTKVIAEGLAQWKQTAESRRAATG